MAPKQATNTTQTTKVELPKWVDQAAQSNYKLAQEIANKPLQQYQGSTVAGAPQTTLDAYNMFKSNLGTGQQAFSDAQTALSQLTGFNPGSVTAQQVNAPDKVNIQDIVAGKFADTDLSKYMNPYIDNVENKALGALNDQRVQALMGNADKAAAAKSFGGSRSAIVDAVTNSESAKAAGLLSADLRKSGFDTAANLAVGDITRDLAAQQTNQGARLSADTTNASNQLQTGMANQSANLQGQLANLDAALKGAGIQSNVAAGLLDTGKAQQASMMQDFMGLLGIGQQEQGQKQKEIDADVAKFNEARDYDTERLNLLLSSLGMSPYGKTETANKQTNGSSSPDWASAGVGLAQLLGGIFSLSEDTEKTDKKKVGKVPGTDLDLWSYRYKGDPKTYPKVVGVMASDVQKKMPKAVKTVGNKRVVDYRHIAAQAGA